MTAAASASAGLDRRFEAIVFDWDGTAVPDRRAGAGSVREAVEAACALGLDVAIVSGTHVGNIDGQLQARPAGPGALRLCLNRGSEVFAVDERGVRTLYRRLATAAEDEALSAAAELTVARLGERGLRAQIVSRRLNRRKLDLIPERAWADPPKARIAELLAAVQERLVEHGFGGLREVVELAEAAAREAGLADPRVTSDVKHVEIGLTDKSDSARWIFRNLWSQGIAPGSVLIVGDEFGRLGGLPGSDSLMLLPEAARATAVSVGVEPTGVPGRVIALGGGPPAFLRVLEDQVERRRRRDVPHVDPEPGWRLGFEGLDPELERVRESLLTLADGRLGTSGSVLLTDPAGRPAVLAAGVYDGEGPEKALLPCPLWHRLGRSLEPGTALTRVLDLRTGLLRQELLAEEGQLEAVLFSSLARPGTVALWTVGPRALLAPGPPLRPPPGEHRLDEGTEGGRSWLRVNGSEGGVAVAASESRAGRDGGWAGLVRLAAYEPGPPGAPPARAALERLADAERAGCERLLVEHRRTWAARWETADVVIEGDPELQLAVRFALYHLMAAAAGGGEAAVGARGLTGSAYRGHVFWDSDVFVLPFLAATHPEAARAMLEYRIRRLPAAQAAAKALGRDGARFPWESAATGADVTPPHAHLPTGEIVPIRTGELEEHIVADVAWAVCCYLDWTGDEEFAAGPGRALLVETARYWASRVRLDAAGRGHIDGVIGPDEYHEPVDDNAYTNVMARWNLRRAAQAAAAVPDEPSERERERWLELASALVDGHDPATGLYEQFAGFFALEPLVIADAAPSRPIVADVLLGRERVRFAQVIKQADVLMLHHLVPDEVAPGSLVANLRFYEPRTAHGSSLSPGVHAALFARAGQPEEALGWLRLTGRIDLDDVTRTTAGGLHLAAMGSVWQAIAFGFAGLRPWGGVLRLDPCLPREWSALELRLRFRGSRFRLRIGHEALDLWADPPVSVRVAGTDGDWAVPPQGLRLGRVGERWERGGG